MSEHPAVPPLPAGAAPVLRWEGEALWLQLEPLRPGLSVEVLPQATSTNTLLLDRARAGHDLQPCLLVAEHQSAGRGRQGKAWLSAPGASLTFSLALPLAPASWSGLSLAVGLALAEALDPARPGQPPRIGLKWPNDLLLHSPGRAGPGRKLGGILIETVQAGAQRVAVVGVGLNLRPLAADEASLSWGQASLHELHAGITAPQALARVARPLLQALIDFEHAGFAPLQARFAPRDVLAGQPVSTTLASLPQGVADGVDADGTLWLRLPDGSRQPVASGEVSLRPAPAATAAVRAPTAGDAAC